MPSGEKSTPGGNAGWGGPPKGAGRGGPARYPKKEFKKSGEPNVGVALVPDFEGRSRDQDGGISPLLARSGPNGSVATTKR